MDQKLVSFIYRSVDETELHAVFFFHPATEILLNILGKIQIYKSDRIMKQDKEENKRERSNSPHDRLFQVGLRDGTYF